jgi:ATP-dependent RNA helicase DDX51/DBP6
MIDVSQVEAPSSGQAKEETLPTLPSFPLPSLPDAPPKSVLALQGLDQALLDAEFVDPTTTSPVSEEEDDPVTGLSLKTRQRLKELGIEEFFAGMTFPVFPMNIPSDRPKNSQCRRGFCHFSFL